MKISLTNVFCEVITGFALLLVLVPMAICWEWVDLQSVYNGYDHWLGIGPFTILIVACYTVGVVFDSVGLCFDEYQEEWIRRGWIEGSQSPCPEETAQFYANVSAHMLDYRNHVWAYYFCYRNLLIVTPFIFISWGLLYWKTVSLVSFVCVLVVAIFLVLIFWKAHMELLDLYHEITTSYGEAGTTDNQDGGP